MRHETIDAFILTGCTGLTPGSAQTYRSWLRHMRATLAWLERGEQTPSPMTAPKTVSPPYTSAQLGRLRGWAERLPGQARADALVLMALAFGCGLASGEVAAIRTGHLRRLDSTAVVVCVPGTDRLIVCRANWENVLAEAASQSGDRFVFRPQRVTRHAKNLFSSWTARHAPTGGLPCLSVRRLRSSWIVELLTARIDLGVVAAAAGMSASALARYQRFVPAKATLAEGWRIAAFCLTSRARHRLGLPDIDPEDVHQVLASSRRFYRAFDRLTTLLDPARHDRRTRLPQHQADLLAAAWDDDDLDHQRKRNLLQRIVTALVLTPVRRAKGRGYLRDFRGDVGIDTTAAPVFARPPRTRHSTGERIASTEITAGWHHSAGNNPAEYGYSATLTVAARTRAVSGSFPQMALGLVVDTPGKRIGANAVTTLKPLPALGLPAAFAAVDRAYTDQQPAHFAQPARQLGYKLALDYKRDQRGVQGSVHGALLVDGSLACPLMLDRLAHATTGLDDSSIHTPTEELATLIRSREPYWLRLKQSPNNSGAVRFQCPAAGTSPSVTCPRFDRLHQREPGRPTPVDLTDPRRRAAHSAAKPRVLAPHPDPKIDEWPKICRQHSITVHAGDLGHLDKLRQDLPYLSPAWIGTYKAIRANTEGLNGRLKGHNLDHSDPKNRLAHGRVAQTLLVALLVTVANDHFLDTWHHQHQDDSNPVEATDPGIEEATDLTTNEPPRRSRPPPGP